MEVVFYKHSIKIFNTSVITFISSRSVPYDMLYLIFKVFSTISFAFVDL